MKFQDAWEHLRSFWGRVDEVAKDETSSSSPSGVNPALDEVCKAQNAKLFFSILDTTISGEQMVLFLFVGMILGYGIGAFKSRKRRVAGLGIDYPRQTPRLPALPHRNVAHRSARQTRRQHNNRSNLTGRGVPHERNSFGYNPEFGLTRTSILAQENDNHYVHTNSSEYYTPTAPPRTPMPHSYY